MTATLAWTSITEARASVTYGGYHTKDNMEAGERQGEVLVTPERYHSGVQGPYFKELGVGVYQRLGFKEYCRVSSYDWWCGR